MLDDLIPHPFASILFALVLGALFLWQGFEENRPPKRLAHVRPAVLTEKPQAARLSLANPICITPGRNRYQGQANEENRLSGPHERPGTSTSTRWLP